MYDDEFWKKLIARIDSLGPRIDALLYADDNSEIKLRTNNVQLIIYRNDNLIGYKIHPVDSPNRVFLSDNDLYRDESIKKSVREEIAYILNEFIEKRITLHARYERTWYGKTRKEYYIALTLPSGERSEYRLPCINQVSLGL